MSIQSELEKCLPKDSWLTSWMESWPLAESPRSFILLSGMAMVGAVLGRRVYFDQDFHKLFPMLNLLLIGPSGVGKSTGLGMGFSLVWRLPKQEQPQIISGATTTEKLYEDLQANPHAILYASELASFFSRQKYMESLVPAVTELLDYRHENERRTRGGGIITVPEPAVTVVGCSTVEWLQEQLPDSATSGGFLARFLIVTEEVKAQRVALPGRALSKTQRKELYEKRENVYNGFNRIIHYAPKGPFDFKDYEASGVYEKWYQNHQPVTGHLAPFHARAGEFILRLAMIAAICRERAHIDVEDLELATKIYSHVEAKLQGVVVPFSPAGKMLAMVLQAVGNGTRSELQLAKAMRNFTTSQEVSKLVISLVQSGDLIRTPEGKFKRAV